MLSTGCQVTFQEAWDAENQLVVSGYRGPKGETDVEINNTLRKEKDQMETAFKYYEVNEERPTLTQVVERYQERLNGKPYKKKEEKESEKKALPKKEPGLLEVFQMFVTECGEKNAWSIGTFKKMATLKEDLVSFKKNVSFSDLDEKGLTAFVHYLREKKVLNSPRKKKGDRDEYDDEDVMGLRNSTIQKKLGFLKWFLKWATDRGYNTNTDFKTFRPTLKTTQRKVIYLSKPELERLRKLEIPAGLPSLEAVRDVFLFCCFSGLRHSDVYNLRKNDIKENHIEVTTIKTGDSISIELNNVTRDILRKYKDYPFADNRVLPVIQNQPMNRHLKDLCKLAGINEQIRITTYKGNQRKDEIKEKWELVGTHTGRRTFIVNCLSLGIPPNVVMKWTGHSDYKAMKPYIDIVDSIKASEMTKLDSLF
jgi:integrase